jgi:hypothetical protein
LLLPRQEPRDLLAKEAAHLGQALWPEYDQGEPADQQELKNVDVENFYGRYSACVGTANYFTTICTPTTSPSL